MVACDQAGAPETPAATAEVIPTAVSDYAQDLAGEEGVCQFLSSAGSYDHVLKEGTLELYRAQLGTRDFDPDTTTLAGGMSIDENGYLFDGWTTLFLFQHIGEDYVPLTTASYVDCTAVQAAVDALLAHSDPALAAAGQKFLCRSLLEEADVAFAPLIAAATIEGDPWVDGNGVTRLRLAGYQQWDEQLRMDDQVFSGLLYRFGRETATELFQTYVYVPDPLFLEWGGGLWVRADAAEVLDWDYTADVSTLFLTEASDTRYTFTLEGTDHGQPCTWTFQVQRSSPQESDWIFTKYYRLDTPYSPPSAADGKPAALVSAVETEMDRKAGELEATLGVTITGRVITELEMAGGTGGTLGGLVRTLADGYVLEAWRFDYRLRTAPGTPPGGRLRLARRPQRSGPTGPSGPPGRPVALHPHRHRPAERSGGERPSPRHRPGHRRRGGGPGLYPHRVGLGAAAARAPLRRPGPGHRPRQRELHRHRRRPGPGGLHLSGRGPVLCL